jgi:hypothetical protein
MRISKIEYCWEIFLNLKDYQNLFFFFRKIYKFLKTIVRTGTNNFQEKSENCATLITIVKLRAKDMGRKVSE